MPRPDQLTDRDLESAFVTVSANRLATPRDSEVYAMRNKIIESLLDERIRRTHETSRTSDPSLRTR